VGYGLLPNLVEKYLASPRALAIASGQAALAGVRSPARKVGPVADKRVAGARAAITVLMAVGPDIYELPCTLVFRADQPFEIRATFYTGEVYVQWVFSRELMWEGLRGPAGQGDVVIRPQYGDCKAKLLIELRVGPQAAVLQADRALIEGFLNQTFEIVAMGSECLWPEAPPSPAQAAAESPAPPTSGKPPSSRVARGARSPSSPGPRRSRCRQASGVSRCRIACPSARRRKQVW
jgi:hypothetical protein